MTRNWLQRFTAERERGEAEPHKSPVDAQGVTVEEGDKPTARAVGESGAKVVGAVVAEKLLKEQTQEISPQSEAAKELTDRNPEARKIETKLKKQVLALKKIATQQTDPTAKVKISLKAAELGQLHMEVVTELAAGRAIPDTKLAEIKRKKSEIESKDPEDAPVVQLAKTVVNATDRLSKNKDGTVDESKFEENLEKVVQQTEIKDAQSIVDGADTGHTEQVLAELKQKLSALSNHSLDDQKLEQLINNPQLALVLDALKRGTITTADIEKADLENLPGFEKEGEEPLSDKSAQEISAEASTPITPEQSNILDSAEINLEEADFQQLTKFMQERLQELAEDMESHESSAVRKRLEMATPVLDLVLSRAISLRSPISEEQIDFVLSQFNLLPEDAEIKLALQTSTTTAQSEATEGREKTEAPETDSTLANTTRQEAEKPQPNIARNYENAQITREAYKRILAERNQQLLEQQEIRLQGLENLTTQDENFAAALSELKQSLNSIEQPVERAQRISEFISDHNRESEANEALKNHFLEDIKQAIIELKKKEGVEDFQIGELTGEVTMSLDGSGYYVLMLEADDFRKLTLSKGNERGAAYKKGSIYLIRKDKVHDEQNTSIALETDPNGEVQTREVPSLVAVAHHEIVHLEFDDARKVNIERETIFTAQKILNLVATNRSDLSAEAKTELLEQIIVSLTSGNTNSEDQDAIYQNILNISGLSVAENGFDNRSVNIKIEHLIKHHRRRLSELMAAENDEGRQYLQVEELAAELTDKMTVSDGKLTLDAIGVGINEEFSIWREILSSQEQARHPSALGEERQNRPNKFNVHNIEAMNMLRIINQAIPEDYSTEDRQQLVDKWARRIMKFQDFNTTNTLSFIFEMITQDGIELSDKLTPKLEIAENQESIENQYLKFADRYRDGSFKYYLLDQLNQGKLGSGGKTPEEINSLIEQVYEIYKSVVLQGLEGENRADIASTEEREVENELFKFATRPKYDQLIQQHYQEGRVGHPYSAAWPEGWNRIMEELGLKVKDVTEKGLMFKWGKKKDPITGKWVRTLRHGFDATLMPVKPWANLPLGWGEDENKINLAKKLLKVPLKVLFGIDTDDLVTESFLSSHYRHRTGESQLSMDIQDIHALMVENINERLQKTKHYRDNMQIYRMLYDRVGLVHFEGGKITMTHEGLTKHRDTYLSRHLYAATNPSGALLASPPALRSRLGKETYDNLVSRGYSGLDLHLLMEAYKENQVLIDSTGASTTINARDYPITLGTITERMAQRIKMMRTGGEAASRNDKAMTKYIDQGNRFDEISKFIMELQLKSYQNAQAAGITDPDAMRLYSMEDVIKAIEKVDDINPGKSDLGPNNTDTVERWINVKSKVTLSYDGSSKVFSRDDLKEYVRCFYYGRTYEAMASGVYGEQQIVRLADTDASGNIIDVFFEVTDGYGIIGEEDKQKKVNEFIGRWNYPNEGAKAMYDTANGIGKFDGLSYANQQIAIKNYKQTLVSSYAGRGLTLKEVSNTEIPEEFRPTTVGIASIDDVPYDKLFKYKKPGQDIYISLPGQPTPQVVKAREGLTKDEMNMEFGDFTQNDAGLAGPNDPNAYTLKNIEPKLINAVEDVIDEKSQVSAEYFYLRQLMKQAGDYTGKASFLKERWVGRARAIMLLRWLHTGLTIGALVAFPPALAGLLLNPWMLGLLLANYFVIGNWATRKGELWGKRKTSGIAATNKLKELEPVFEKAFFDPKFSLGPERDRLYQLLKTAEDILKGALVTSVDTPSNLLQDLTKITAETTKEMATK